MKDPAPPRSRKPPLTHKLKFLCSSGGDFLPCHGDLRYVGGESRILSVDRRGGVGLSKLLSRVSEIHPNRPISLKYQPPGASSPLAPIASDDDVRRMIDGHDWLVAQGKAARLRVFVYDETHVGIRYVAPQNPVFSTRACGLWVDSSEGIRGLGRGVAISDGNSRTHIRKIENFSYSPREMVIGSRITTSHVKGVPFSGDLYRESALEYERSVFGVETNQFSGHGSQLGCTCNHGSGSLPAGYHAIVGNRRGQNVFPWNANRGPVGTCLSPVSFGMQLNSRVFQSRTFGGSSSHSRISQNRRNNHGGRDARCDDTRSCQTRSGELGTLQKNDGKFCTLKGYPGLRPRSNISKVFQGRSHQNHLVKPVKVNRGQPRERVIQANVQRSPDDHQYVFHLNPNINESAFPNLDLMLAVDDHFIKQDTAENVACEDNPFRTEPKESMHQTAKSGDNSNGLDKELCLLKAVKTGNLEALFPPSHSICDLPGKEAERNEMELSNNNAYPQLNLTHQLDDFNLSGAKSSLGLSMRNLSISPAKHRQPTPSAPLSIWNGLKLVDCAHATSTLSIHGTMPQFNSGDMMEYNTFNSGLPNANITEEVNKNHSDLKSDISIEDSTGLMLLEKVPQSPSLPVTQVCVETKIGLICEGKNLESLLLTPTMENKEDALTSKNPHFKNKTICKQFQLCSRLVGEELQTIKHSDLEEIRKLGSGAYGTVFYGKWKGSDVAIKRLKPSCFAEGELQDDRMITDFWKEARLLGQLHHPNVVAFYGVVTDGPELATVTEYMVNGSLKQVLRRKDRTIDRRKRLIIAMDAAFGMEYLHEKNIVHFDLKSPNFLVNMRDPHRPVCKIGDLGLSKVKQRTLVSGGVRGTIPWMAPELLMGKSNMVTEKVDVYSFGIVMWELLSGEEPYENMRSEEIIAGIFKGHLRPQIPSWCDPAWKSLMERCWSSDPSARPSFSEIAKELRIIASSMNIQ